VGVSAMTGTGILIWIIITIIGSAAWAALGGRPE
jgi:hypothetical protein